MTEYKLVVVGGKFVIFFFTSDTDRSSVIVVTSNTGSDNCNLPADLTRINYYFFATQRKTTSVPSHIFGSRKYNVSIYDMQYR